MDCSLDKSCGHVHFVTATQVAGSGNSLIRDLLVKLDLAGASAKLSGEWGCYCQSLVDNTQLLLLFSPVSLLSL